MPSSPDPLSIRGAGQLSRVWLDAVNFEANPDYDPAAGEIRYHLTHGHALAFGEGEIENSAVVRLNVIVEWRDSDDQELGRPGPFNLELGIAGVFEWERPEVDREIFAAWLEWNSVYLLWPYVRSHIGMLTAASPFAPLTIYTLRVPDPPAPRAIEATDSARTGQESGKAPPKAKAKAKAKAPATAPKTSGTGTRKKRR